MPKLTSLTTTENSWAFCHPRAITLGGSSILVHSLIDLPELKEVILPKGFSHARAVAAQGSSVVSQVSLLDVGAFQSFLSERGIPTLQPDSGCCSAYSLLCCHTHSCSSHYSHFFHFFSILAISTHILYHTFSHSSLHSPLFFPVLLTAFTHLS